MKDGEAEIVAKIQEWRRERLTISEIADRLNSERFKTRSGGQWHFTQVRRVLARGRRMRTNILDRGNRLIGWTVEDSTQIRVFDRTGRRVGYDLKSSDTTHTTHRFFGRGIKWCGR